MGLTGKQERNGITVPGGTQNSGQTGPIPDVAGVKPQSEVAALERTNQTQGIFESPQGSGPSPASTIDGAERQIGAGGNMWEWDAGLAIKEAAG